MRINNLLKIFDKPKIHKTQSNETNDCILFFIVDI